MNLFAAFRSIVTRPAVPIVAIATLALGLGVNAAIFSLTREMLLRPLPYRDADRLVRVFESSRALGRSGGPVAPVNYTVWQRRVGAFEHTALFRRVAINVSANADAVQVEGFLVDAAFFPMLGVAPSRGRGFDESDTQPGRDAIVLLSHGFWQRQFAGDPAIVGRTIDVDGTPCTVVGVLPSSFTIFHVLNREVHVFRPLVLDRTDREQSLNVYAKLKPNASLDAARAQLAVAYASMPGSDRLWTGDAEPLSKSFANQSRPTLVALQWAVALVLLIACANIANLLLAASARRKKELAVRQALGASPWRVARDLAGETLMLTIAGGALAVVLATGLVAVLNTAVSYQVVNRLHPFRLDVWVLAFTGALTLSVTLLFGVLPARDAAATDVVDALKDSTQGVTHGVSNRRLRHALVVAQLALSITLTTAAVALARTAMTLHGLPRGVVLDHVMTAQLSLTGPRYDDTTRLTRATAAMVERLTASPGIRQAALVNYPPMSLIRLSVPIAIEGQTPPQPNQPWIARHWIVSPGYFQTAGIPLRAGRDFRAADDAAGPGVAVVGESFARRIWNRVDVVGQRLKTDFPDVALFWIPRARRDWLTVVGVVGDVREDGLPAADLPQLYLPYAQNPTTTVTLMARTGGQAPEAVMPAMREAARNIDPQVPVSYEASFDNVVRETFARPRELAWLVGSFAALALILSAIGVSGVTACLTAARAREIGIRLALGATRVDVVRLIVAQTLSLTAIGMAIGVVLAPLSLRLVSGVLFGVGAFDAVTLLVVCAVLVGVSTAASSFPAIRAARAAAASFR